MRHRFSNAFREVAVVSAGVVLGLAAAAPAVTVGASSASAALRPVVGCGFHFGPITNQGAAGTLFYMAQLEPANPAQRCTTALTFTVSARPTSGGSYTTIDHNPLTATQTVSFAPGRLQPQVTIAWQAFHCADPAVPGAITFSASGQSGATPIQPSSCFTMGHSNFASMPVPQPASEVGIAPTASNHGYRFVNDHGGLAHFGDATSFTAAASHSPVVGIASPRSGNGAWVAAADGGVFAYGSAPFEGSLGAIRLNQPVVGIAPTPSGHGYWLVASDGGVFSFGDATFHGSMGGIPLNSPVVGMGATPDGHGYWLVAADGGIFAFGSAAFAGSLGSVLLNAPIVGMAAAPHGYWLVGSDGSIFAFGGAPFEGSKGGTTLNAPVSGMAATSTGHGYWLVGADGNVYAFGDAHSFSPVVVIPVD